MPENQEIQDQLRQAVADFINDLPAIDELSPAPAPTPTPTAAPHPAAVTPDFHDPRDIPPGASTMDQPAQAAFGACVFSDGNAQAAAAIHEWQKQLSEQCNADLVSILAPIAPLEHEKDQPPSWVLIWMLPEYRSDNDQQLQEAVNRWTLGPAQGARGSQRFCTRKVLDMLVNAGATTEEADDQLANALQALLQAKMERSSFGPDPN